MTMMRNITSFTVHQFSAGQLDTSVAKHNVGAVTLQYDISVAPELIYKTN